MKNSKDMKQLFLLLALFSISVVGLAQTPIKDGIKVGRIFPKIVNSDELKTLVGVDTTKTIKEQLDAKIDTVNAIDASTLYYTKQEIQNLPIQDELVAGLRLYGSQVKALPFGVALPHLFASTATLTDGLAYYALFEIKDTITVTGVGWVQQTQGAYTADGYNGFAINTISGGTDTKFVETVNDGNLWKAVLGSATKAFAEPVVLLPGNYKISALWNSSASTTAPAIYAHTAGSANLTYLLPNSQKVSGTIAAQSTMPTSVANSSLVHNGNYLGLYLY